MFHLTTYAILLARWTGSEGKDVLHEKHFLFWKMYLLSQIQERVIKKRMIFQFF